MKLHLIDNPVLIIDCSIKDCPMPVQNVDITLRLEKLKEELVNLKRAYTLAVINDSSQEVQSELVTEIKNVRRKVKIFTGALDKRWTVKAVAPKDLFFHFS